MEAAPGLAPAAWKTSQDRACAPSPRSLLRCLPVLSGNKLCAAAPVPGWRLCSSQAAPTPPGRQGSVGRCDEAQPAPRAARPRPPKKRQSARGTRVQGLTQEPAAAEAWVCLWPPLRRRAEPGRRSGERRKGVRRGMADETHKRLHGQPG